MGRRRRIALAVALVLLAALLALWIARRPIATRFVDRTLAAANVPARYTVADLGLGRQRLTDVVIGDPRAPDLVADWIETRTRIGLDGAELKGVRAGRLRVRGRLVDGRLSLGAIDRLLPRSGGGPFALPRLDLDVEDGRMRLETPYGVVGLALRGRGRLDAGFAGRMAVVSRGLTSGDCAVEQLTAVLAVRSTRDDVIAGSGATGGVRAEGPVRFAAARCAGVRTGALRSDLAAGIVTGRRVSWNVGGRIDLAAPRHPLASAAKVSGSFRMLGGGTRITTWVGLSASDVRAGDVRAGRVALDGDVVRDRAVALGYAGTVEVADADVRARLPALAPLVAATEGTPVAPLVAQVTRAIGAAATRVGGAATVDLATGPRSTAIRVASATLASASGARVAFEGPGVDWRSTRGLRVDGTLGLSGGGLPQASARVLASPGAPFRAAVTVAPYAAGGARLALTPVVVTGGATTRIVTRATLSGPLADGRVEGLTVPLDLRVGGGGVAVNTACTPLAFDRLAVSELTLNPARLTLCPTGVALVRVANGVASGGARIAATRLGGAIGTTPVTLGLAGATLRLAGRGFALEGVETRIGAPGRVTRLDFARIDGRVAAGGIAGSFAGWAGQIANVPLVLGAAAGDWRFARGRLSLTGALGVSDAQQPAPRFQPMQARQVALGLEGGTIVAIGALHEPTTGAQVAKVAIRHALGPGTGEATLEVPDLTFAKGFQPELLTRLTFGVIADVAGTVSGAGHIAWSPAGVTSTGTFRTAGTDLAAAFGPVTGIAGEMRFTDLLGLESAPGQVVTIGSVNPGIAVTDGTIRYQLLPGTRIRIEGGEWPFAGGRLTLDPTLLDFAETAERRMTFHVHGVAADRFLQQFDFKNLDATGTFDGILPMVFDESGGRIEGGRMTVREGGGTIAYVGDLSEKQLGFWGDFAFQALKSLRYRSLTLTMNGPLAGEMITDVRFAGVSQGEGAKTNILIRRLQRLPLVFNVRIKAPFRGLLDSAQSFYDPRRLIRRNLPALLERQGAPVQPPASEPVPQKD